MSFNLKSNFKKLKYLLVLVFVVCMGFVYSLVVWDIPLDTLKSKYSDQVSQYVNINGVNVHYKDEGQGTPIVLIHGTGASLHTWDYWSKELKKKYRVIRMDLPAFGLTGPNSSSDYSIQGYTIFMKDFLSKLQIENSIIVGNSLGGNIAWNFAADHPRKVNKLILIDASGYPSNKKRPWIFKLAKIPVLNSVIRYITPKSIIRKNLEQVYFDDQKITDAVVDRYYDLALRKGNRQAFIDRTKVIFVDQTQKLKNLDTETLLIWGDNDVWIPVDVGYKFEKDLPNATLITIENTGHIPMEESPKKSLDVLIKFLKKK